MPLDNQVSDILTEFAHTMNTDFPIQAVLDGLVGRIVDILPIRAAGVTLLNEGMRPRYVAASDSFALLCEELQSKLGEGPCIRASTEGSAVAFPDLSSDCSFLRFTPAALEIGLKAVFAFPICQGDKRLGVLDLYCDKPGALSLDEMVAAQTLADVASAYISNATARLELRESTKRSEHIALHDSLTGLPNRVLLLERIRHAIDLGFRSGKIIAILFVDLDQFKLVNDTYGHHVGDELLVAVARRLTSLLRPGDTLSRLAGDEFVIMCENLDALEQAEMVAHRIGKELSESFSLLANDISITASVGVAYAGSLHYLPEDILRDADAAMYQAKRLGGGRYALFDQHEQDLFRYQMRLRRDLRHALLRGELVIVYQPIVHTVDGQIVGVEALLRWVHPIYGLIDPSVFIPLAEASGAIIEIGLWVLEQSCLALRRWRGWADKLQVFVNVSPRQLLAPGFAASVALILSKSAVAPELVTLEVTESTFVQGSEQPLFVFNELKLIGVSLALDDFGTGFSSLSYLKRFPIDVVKIDRSFIAELSSDPECRSIVRAIVGLARDLSLKVIAEGVETAEEWDHVAQLECALSQGFFFARPMSVESLDLLLEHGAGRQVVGIPIVEGCLPRSHYL